jgi:hypothetical protein
MFIVTSSVDLSSDTIIIISFVDLKGRRVLSIQLQSLGSDQCLIWIQIKFGCAKWVFQNFVGFAQTTQPKWANTYIVPSPSWVRLLELYLS